MFTKMIAFPNAKINIGLNIVSRRADGYHDLETVFYPIKINDAVEVIETDTVSFTSSGIEIPGDADENLCLKAYYLIKQDVHIPPIHIHLHKNIPIGAGLGGGSADAAFFIRLLNDKFKLSLSIERMHHYARQLGADCAFFIDNIPSFAHGRGDQFEDIQLDLSGYFITLVKPPIHISTADAYKHVQPQTPDRSLKELILMPVETWKDYVLNDFEDSVAVKYPQVAVVKSSLYEAGAIYAAMSGSGSSVYGIFSKETLLPALEEHNEVFYNV